MLYPLGTGRKLNVYKTSRRRPGRPLNVLYTFNLGPVPKDYGKLFLKRPETSLKKRFRHRCFHVNF